MAPTLPKNAGRPAVFSRMQPVSITLALNADYAAKSDIDMSDLTKGAPTVVKIIGGTYVGYSSGLPIVVLDPVEEIPAVPAGNEIQAGLFDDKFQLGFDAKTGDLITISYLQLDARAASQVAFL